ncbi:DNA translocase FtsK 4TM domain-containing protein [Psychrobacter sp. PAMC 21119]|uniref:DNA translocase FtsK 4TM domain-containing protein n=1 Tax=Psychrobacter sp. PAMC 21119 TaxID=1112209 RepID=UPI00028A04A2|nr:DNA translocase FtsK 4TM domain-containing protein [Psychrobacter sp. PAMC 21119]
MISAPLIEYLKKGIFTLLGLILAVYLFVILMTYTGNDPSWSHISSDMTTINNMGGEMGAWLSDLLYSFFGFGAWWLLAFVVYESILIWWDNKPTFWLLRVVAYVFLILSASALFAQLVALVQQIADPVTTGLTGVAGGIIGLELQARLAQLLSQWGSVVFLTVFVIITATFAFNIHWLAIYRKIMTLSWLGSGVKNQDSQYESVQAAEKSRQQHNEALTDEKVSHVVPEYDQLPLELQATEHEDNTQQSDSSGRFNHVLTEFLASSGLGASVKASMAAATQVSAVGEGEHLQSVPATPSSAGVSNFSDNKVSATPSPVTTPSRKVEPSFAWNDANTVDDLLASDMAIYDQSIHSATHDADSATPAYINNAESPKETAVSINTATDTSTDMAMLELETPSASSTVNPNKEDVEQAVTETASKQIAPNFADESQTMASDDSHATDETNETIATLAESWLSEHAPVSPSQETEEDTNKPEQPALKTAVENTYDASAGSSDQLADKLSNEEQWESSLSIQSPAPEENGVSIVAPVADMTPTNTPPTNPTLPPKVETNVSAPAAEPIAASKPTVSFAVPEGDSGNHITDMMPEDDSRDDDSDIPVMPHISDDGAFSQKSRSMQTAAYRSSLTPIPEISILDKPDPDRKPSYTIAELDKLSELLEIKLQEFNVKAAVVNAIPGPVVTRFEVELAAGVKASKVTGISRDLARSLSMASLRVVEVIPGKPYIGIEVPNKQREMVRLIELLNTEKFQDPKAQISMAMGKDIGGNAIITDLARAPHMLVAGTTGSGKSVLVNSMLLSMLLKYTPNELRLILIDPKQLELANYNDIPHLLTPVVTDMTEAASALSWCVAEMERRYQLMSLLKVRKLNEFNKKVIAAEKSGNPMLDPLWRPNDSVSISQAPKLKTLPMIVIVADEFADMIMQVGKQAEELITRLAQKSRAAGIHLMLATQRPSVDVITGLIKANIPVRAALRVNSKVDSRTILDSGGAEDMLGNGDMLFLGPGQIEPDRVHGAYVSDEEVNRVCDAWRERGAPDYIDNMAGNFELSSPGGGGSSGNASGEDDDLYNDAVAFIMETRKVSASSIQRKFSIGYNRAARIVDSMEEAGLVSSMGKSGKRELLM